METEEITKLVDGIYKNILDKFNPGARQMINAGKAYLKALHGAAAASRLYVDAITKLARQSQQGTWGGSADIGSALMQIVEVYKEIQAQQMNILKAFYVDLLVPLETNLEKDTKVVQSEQKKFLQQHKQRSETYSKAAATIKKQRKKQRNTAKTGIAMDKELKSMQILEEERSKLDAFCEQSLKNAMTQERRRYGFVLERQCSLAKHYLAFHTAGHTLYQNHLDDWQEVAKTREFLPHSVENMFANKLTEVSFWAEGGGSPKSGEDEERGSVVSSQLRKTKSMDASCLDVRAIAELSPPHQAHHRNLTRAKSDFNLTASSQSLAQEMSSGGRPKSMAVPAENWDTPLARAMYAYLSSGDNQLSFLEGDVIALMGERNKGWQFGENLRTQASGWFPLAYTEPFIDDSATSASSPTRGRGGGGGSGGGVGPGAPEDTPSPAQGNLARPATLTRFGDTLTLRNIPQDAEVGASGGGGNGYSMVAGVGGRGQPPNCAAPRRPPAPPRLPTASLHSSNDSGFSNDPPPAPEVDYSDDDTPRNGVEKNRRRKKGWHGSENDWVVRQASSAGELATLGRSGEDAQLRSVQRQLRAIEMPCDKKVKRTKSLWKFKRGGVDEPIEGMSMWRHRSLIDVTREGGTPRPVRRPLTLGPRDGDEETLKREEETSSEDESCIVVDDHRKREEPALLPRTRLLSKSHSIATRENSILYNSFHR